MTRKDWIQAGMVAAVLLLGACRPPQPALPPPPSVSLSIQPTEATVTMGHDLQFGHRITSGSGTGVAWRVVEPGGGSIDAQGRYRARSGWACSPWRLGPRPSPRRRRGPG